MIVLGLVVQQVSPVAAPPSTVGYRIKDQRKRQRRDYEVCGLWLILHVTGGSVIFLCIGDCDATVTPISGAVMDESAKRSQSMRH